MRLSRIPTLLLCCISLRSQDRPRTEVIEQIKNSIFEVEAHFIGETVDKEGKMQPFALDSTGTGFIADASGHIATAAHVVGTTQNISSAAAIAKTHDLQIVPDSFKRDSVKVRFALPNRHYANGGGRYAIFTGLLATVATEDDDQDIALLTCIGNPLQNLKSVMGSKVIQPALPALATSEPADGEPISLSGYPLGLPVVVTTNGWLATSFFEDENRRFLYLGDIQVNHGNSGGPVYNSTTGKIMGMAVEFKPAIPNTPLNSGLTVIVPISSVLKLVSASVKSDIAPSPH